MSMSKEEIIVRDKKEKKKVSNSVRFNVFQEKVSCKPLIQKCAHYH
jgi:hypothetical protein